MDTKRTRHARVGPARLWSRQRDFQIRFLQEQGLREDHRLIDFGCGTLRGGIPIIRYLGAESYAGVDIDPESLAQAEQECCEEGVPIPTLRLWHPALDLDLQADIVWAFSVLVHTADSTLEQALCWVRRHLQPDGAFFANVNIGLRRTEEHSRHNHLVWRPKMFYEMSAAKAGFTCEWLGTLEDLGHRVGRPAMDEQWMLACRPS